MDAKIVISQISTKAKRVLEASISLFPGFVLERIEKTVNQFNLLKLKKI